MELYGIAFFDLEDFSKLLFKFGINFIFLIIIVRLIYYKMKDDKAALDKIKNLVLTCIHIHILKL